MSQCMSNSCRLRRNSMWLIGLCFFLCPLPSFCVEFSCSSTVYGTDGNLNSMRRRTSQRMWRASWPFAARDGGQTPTLITGFGADPLPARSICHRILDGLLHGLSPRFAPRRIGMPMSP